MNENHNPATLGTAAPRRLAVRVSEAAQMLSVSRSKAYELVRSGELPSIRVGKVVRVPIEGLEAWVRRQAEEREVL